MTLSQAVHEARAVAEVTSESEMVKTGTVLMTVTVKVVVALGVTPLSAVTEKWKVPVASGMKVNAPLVSPISKLSDGASVELTENVGFGLPVAVTVNSIPSPSIEMVLFSMALSVGATSLAGGSSVTIVNDVK